MGSRRQHLFVLLFVLAFVAVSAVIIASKETKLGLELQGGLQLVYEGQPTGTSTEVSGEDIEDSINIIEKRINSLGVSEAEVAGLGEKNTTVGLPGVTDANRAAEQVGTTAQLYFFDWEPTLTGQERTTAGHPGQQAPPAAVKKLEKEWKAAGRNPESFENGSLIPSGAFPNAYSPAAPPAETEPDETGRLDERAQRGWFALKDNPSLSGSEITEPKQEYTQGSQEPNVSFKFTDNGRDNFQQVTREIALRGASSAIGPVSAEEPGALSRHFAVILD